MKQVQIEFILNDLIRKYRFVEETLIPENIRHLYFHLYNGEVLRSRAELVCVDQGMVRLIDKDDEENSNTSRNFIIPCEEIRYIESRDDICFPAEGSFDKI